MNNTNQIPNTTGEESVYQFFENYRGVEITSCGKLYHAMVYDVESEKSVEFVNTSIGTIKDKIDYYMCNAYFEVIGNILQSFGLYPYDFRLYDSASIQEAIKDKINEEVINTINNL
jgi:hypothetical protein